MSEHQNSIKLNYPVVFSDLNISKGFNPDHITTEITLNVLKYKHIKEMQTIKLEDQMNYALMVITGLSEGDLDELSSEDAAELIGIIHQSLKKYMELAQNVWGGEFGQQMLNQIKSEALSQKSEEVE